MKLSTPAIAVLLVAIGFSGPAAAVTQQRSDYQSAVNNCQGALPSFEGAFRKRPLGIANEGATTAFISCATSAEVLSSTGITTLAVLFTNRTGTAVNVNCTLADGIAAPFGTPIFIAKSFPIPANSAFVGSWIAGDNGGNEYLYPSVSCAIPPGVEVNGSQTLYDTDVGA